MARISGVLDDYHRLEALANALKRQGAAMVRFNKMPKRATIRPTPRQGPKVAHVGSPGQDLVNLSLGMSHWILLSRHGGSTNKRRLSMTAKLNPLTAAPALMKEWHRTSIVIASSLEPGLGELVKIRASQINGCANCLNMH